MRNKLAQTKFSETPMRVSIFLHSHDYFMLTQFGVSYNLFHPLAEKGNVVGVNPEVQIKRVGHALHEERHRTEGVSTKAVVGDEGK